MSITSHLKTITMKSQLIFFFTLLLSIQGCKNITSKQPDKNSSAHDTMSLSVNNYERYPYWLPEWIWKDQLRSALCKSITRQNLNSKISVWAVLDSSNNKYDNYRADSLSDEIAREISKLFALKDIIRDAPLICNKENMSFALQLDPAFDSTSRKTLLEGAKIFAELALNPDVIKEAMSNAIDTPFGALPIYADTVPINEYRLKTFSKDFNLYLRTKCKPQSESSFKTEMRNALFRDAENPGLVIISAYKGNQWWGWTWYDYYYTPSQQLSRLEPTYGYLYSGFNYDSLKVRQDPAFWASKYAHELLHSLGYYHPTYKNWVDRNEKNPPKKMAFIVAYEFAVLRKAKEYTTKYK